MSVPWSNFVYYFLLQDIISNSTISLGVKLKLFRRVAAQKVYVAAKMVEILAMGPEDFEAADLRKLNPNNYRSIFGTEKVSGNPTTDLPIRSSTTFFDSTKITYLHGAAVVTQW